MQTNEQHLEAFQDKLAALDGALCSSLPYAYQNPFDPPVL